MISYRVPERLGGRPEPKKQLHVTAGHAVGIVAFGAAVVTVWSALEGFMPVLPALVAAAVLLAVVAWTFRPFPGAAPLHQFAPSAPAEARERGHLTTAVVEHVTTTSRRNGDTLVSCRLLLTTPRGATYRTTTAARRPRGTRPGPDTGDVVAVRVHPEQRGVVVIVEEKLPVPPPPRPSRPVVEYTGAPTPTRGALLTELGAGLLFVGLVLLGSLAPLVVLARVGQ